MSSNCNLERQRLAGLLRDSGLDIGTAEERVRVWGRACAQRPLRRRVGTLATENGVNDHSIPIKQSVSDHSPIKSNEFHSPVLLAALREDRLLPAVLEHGALHQRLRPHASVDARALLVVVVVEDVRRAEAQERAPRGDLVEVVVGVGNAEVAGVLGGV